VQKSHSLQAICAGLYDGHLMSRIIRSIARFTAICG